MVIIYSKKQNNRPDFSYELESRYYKSEFFSENVYYDAEFRTEGFPFNDSLLIK